MTDTLTLDLAIFNAEGDFSSCFMPGNVRTAFSIGRPMACSILNLAFGLIVGGGSEASRPAAGSALEGDIWPLKDIEEATGMILDPAMFEAAAGNGIGETELVVTQTTFFWRSVSQAFGVLETERTDIMKLKEAFGLPVPADMADLQIEVSDWLIQVCEQGTPDTEVETIVLKQLVGTLLSQMVPSQLEATVKAFRDIAKQDDEYADLLVLHQKDPRDPDKKFGDRLLSKGSMLLSKLVGKR